MIQQRDNFFWFKLNGALRYALVYWVGRRVGEFPLVNEYPKSGGSWFAQLLSEAMGLPFPRNRLPMFRSSLLHGHYRYRPIMTNSAVVWRDGRDVMVSWYYHRVVGNELSSASLTSETAKLLGVKDAQDIGKYLPRFIEHSFHAETQPRFSWSEFVDDWYDKEVFHTKYEDLLVDAASELGRAIDWFGVEGVSAARIDEIVAKYSFQAQSGRKPGSENTKSYLRSGVAGGWKDKFSPEARELYSHYAGKQLIKLGYESDDSWV